MHGRKRRRKVEGEVKVEIKVEVEVERSSGVPAGRAEALRVAGPVGLSGGFARGRSRRIKRGEG